MFIELRIAIVKFFQGISSFPNFEKYKGQSKILDFIYIFDICK